MGPGTEVVETEVEGEEVLLETRGGMVLSLGEVEWDWVGVRGLVIVEVEWVILGVVVVVGLGLLRTFPRTRLDRLKCPLLLLDGYTFVGMQPSCLLVQTYR